MLVTRLWQYQKERFPFMAYGLLVFSLTFAASGLQAVFSQSFFLVFTQAFCCFALLRIADEFKDYEDDVAFRPYRPVPRGLVTLRELAAVGLVCLVVLAGLAFILGNGLQWLIWLGFFALMSKEFFMAGWLKQHPLLYLISHMLSMPLLAWAMISPFQMGWQTDAWFALLALFAGLILEVGRKIRLPEEEEDGVETYSVLWQRSPALLVWLGFVLASTVLVALSASMIRFLPLVISLLFLFTLVKPLKAKVIENLSALMLLVLFIAWGL